MTDFTSGYFRMSEEQAMEYAKEVLNFFKPDAALICKEIGDGNLNYVFKVVDNQNNCSVIIKQAGPVARISDDFKLSPDRNRIESEILKLQNDFAPGFVPEIYHYDPIMNCCAMEDLSDHTIMRAGLMAHHKYPMFAEHISSFLVNTLLSTSDVVMDHKRKKELVKRFINPELCEITEDLVYTEPFYECPRNDVFAPNLNFVKNFIWSDQQLQLETARMKFDFMTKAQCLIHGDLHTGSIFVKEDSMKVIDPEFAFYGPAGYDVGNVVANLMFAYANAKYTMTDEEAKADYLTHLSTLLVDVVNLFQEKFHQKWDEMVTEPVAKYEGFKGDYLNSIMIDTSAVVGLELCRRIIGLAHVADITSIEDEGARVSAEKMCLAAGKHFILNRSEIKRGEDFLRVLQNSEQLTSKVEV